MVPAVMIVPERGAASDPLPTPYSDVPMPQCPDAPKQPCDTEHRMPIDPG